MRQDEAKREIWDRLSAMRKQEYAERRIVLADHRAKWDAALNEIQAACEASGGHEYRPLPDNGINGPHFFTGEWPEACAHCGARPPRRY